MNRSQLSQFLIDITRGHLIQAYQQDPAATVAASDLPAGLQHAIRTQDIAALWQAGASPMALLYFARLSGWDMGKYYACVTQAELKKDVPAHADPTSRHVPPQTHQ